MSYAAPSHLTATNPSSTTTPTPAPAAAPSSTTPMALRLRPAAMTPTWVAPAATPYPIAAIPCAPTPSAMRHRTTEATKPGMEANESSMETAKSRMEGEEEPERWRGKDKRRWLRCYKCCYKYSRRWRHDNRRRCRSNQKRFRSRGHCN
jgi:hypothetical protein